MPTTSLIFQQLGLALLLGLLVGLQRERAEAGMPGLRTFPLITVLGTVSALLSAPFGGWVVVAGFLGVLGVLVFPNLIRLRKRKPDPGITTDVAALLMYAVGALLVALPQQMGVAVAVGGGVAVLLQYKLELHELARRLGEEDVRAIMQFVLISCVILPVLPNKNYLLDALNPRETWLMVVLIASISLGGYVAYKLLGRDAGIVLGAVLGGAVSSTATTASYARQTCTHAASAHVAAVVIMIASTIAFIRVLVEVAVVAPLFLGRLTPPIAAILLLMLPPALAAWRRLPRASGSMPEQEHENPTQLKSAMLFAAMYALVLLALAWVKQHAGQGALYVVACLSGLTDMDAVTLSVARMVRSGHPGSWIATDGWRLVVAAALSNLLFKTAIVAALGNRQLLRHLAALYAIPFGGGLAVILFWP